jgi:hypothetical protein
VSPPKSNVVVVWNKTDPEVYRFVLSSGSGVILLHCAGYPTMASSSRPTAGNVGPVLIGDRGDEDSDDDSSTSNEQVTAPPSAVDDAPQDNICDCKTHYMSVTVGEAKKVLFAMCLGLRAQVDPDDPTAIRYLSDFDSEPYLSIKNKKAFRPMHKHLLDEIQRRFVVLNIPADERFKRSDKNKASMNGARTWLKDHPLTNEQDILFLQAEEKKFYDIQVMARLESRAIASQKSTGGAGGVVLTRTADLRLIHCIIEDGVREAFLRRHDILERDGLDARNAPSRPPAWNQLIANLFNDPNFTGVTEVFPELHSDFAQEISINRSDCPSDISPEQVDFWVTDRKSKLLTVQRRHQLSGNGEGSRRRDIDSENGSTNGNGDNIDEGDNLEYMPDNRAAFLQTERSTILYQWEMFDKYNILDSLLSVLPIEVGVSSKVVPGNDVDDDVTRSVETSLSRRRKRQRRQSDGNLTTMPPGILIQNNQMVAINNMASTLLLLAASQTNSTKVTNMANARASLAAASDAVEQAEKTVLFMTEKLEEIMNPLVKAAYEGRLRRAQERLECAEERYVDAGDAYRRSKEEEN